MNLFKTLIYAVIIYYVWKIVKSLFFVTKNNNINRNFDSNQHTHPPQNKQKRMRNDDEEYVDYEEIK